MGTKAQIIKRYLDGNGYPSDKEIILNWFVDLSAEYELKEEYNKYWNDLDPTSENLQDYDKSRILGEIYHKIKLDETKEMKKNNRIPIAINLITRIAAILFIPLLVYVFIGRDDLKTFKNDISYSEVYAPLGTRTMFYLPDGTKGWLNNDAKIEFPTEFKGKTRQVKLTGEAFFDVKSNPKRPFIVSGNNYEVVATGTSFNVLAYPEEKDVRVTLVSGIVKISAKNGGVKKTLATLKPGQMCIYNPEQSTYLIEKVDTDKVVSWKDGKLVFRNEEFDEVVRRINRWYNAELIIKDERLKSYLYMATFQDETLNEVLKLLKLSAPIEYEDLERVRLPDGTFEKRKIEIYYKP